MTYQTIERLMIIRQLDNKAEIRPYLETDRDYAAFAIGDLDEGFFGLCTWHVAEEGGVIGALALEYLGLAPPVLFLMGASDGVAVLLDGPFPRCTQRRRPWGAQNDSKCLSR